MELIVQKDLAAVEIKSANRANDPNFSKAGSKV